MTVELVWSELDMPLSSFVERFPLPQIVQVADGYYGEDDETTLSSGEELNLHLLKDMQCYRGVTSTGDDILIPLNSPHKVNVYHEKPFDCNIKPEALSQVFPKKYIKVRLCDVLCSSATPDEVLDVLFFESTSEQLICLDSQGCEVTLSLSQLADVIITEVHKDLFLAEVPETVGLPFQVEFKPSEVHSLSPHVRGMITLQEAISKKTILATSRDKKDGPLLTFPSTLDVTVFAPMQAIEDDVLYKSLCNRLSRAINVDMAIASFEKMEEIYDDVKANVINVVPYAKLVFGHPKVEATISSTSQLDPETADLDLDSDGYVDMDDLQMVGFPVQSEHSCPVTPSSIKYSPPNTPPSSPTAMTNHNNGLIRKLTKRITKAMTPGSNPTRIFKMSGYLNKIRSNEDVHVRSPKHRTVDSDGYEIPKEQRRTELLFKKMEDFTVSDVCNLLKDLNLSQYCELFKKELVDGRILGEMDNEMLKSHFQMSTFHVHKLKKAVNENWRPSFD